MSATLLDRAINFRGRMGSGVWAPELCIGPIPGVQIREANPQIGEWLPRRRPDGSRDGLGDGSVMGQLKEIRPDGEDFVLVIGPPWMKVR